MIQKSLLLLHGFPADESAEIGIATEVVIVSDTAASLSALSQHDVDAVLVNLGALPLSARRLLVALRDPQNITDPDLLVIAVLKNNEPKTLQNMAKIGFDHFLTRPFTIAGLLREVRDILKQTSAHRI